MGTESSACRWSDCWCKTWPPMRLIQSTGQYYTVGELESDGQTRVFSYVYVGEAVCGRKRRLATATGIGD